MLGIGAAGSERLREAVFCGGDDLKLSDANKKYEIPPNATMMIAVPVISLALRPKPLLLKSILASGTSPAMLLACKGCRNIFRLVLFPRTLNSTRRVNRDERRSGIVLRRRQ